MKKLILLLWIPLIGSCELAHKPREINAVAIQQFEIPKTSIRALYAVDARSVYYAGSNGTIGFTKSGGENWGTHSFVHVSPTDTINPHFRSMASNGTDVFALSIGNPAQLYKFDVINKTSKLVYTEQHEKVFYDSMQFFDAQYGIAMGDPTGNCLSIIRTEDGGNSWTKIPCEELPKAYVGEAAFAASNTNIKVIGKTAWIATGGNKARVFKSANYGKTWMVYNTPIVQGDGPQGIYSIDFANGQQGIVIGGDYSKPEENKKNVAITSDGGLTWKLVANGQYPNYKSCVQYIPGTQGMELVAVGKTGIAFSNDRGYSWKHVSDESYYTIQFIDKNTAWLAGNNRMAKMTIPKP